MKPQELRLGNWVMHNEDGIFFKVLTIEEFGMSVKNETEETWIEYDQFSGIPLDPEVLEKCGFEKDDNGVDLFHQDYCSWYQKEFPVIGNICTSSKGDYLFDENTDTLRIKYLHQLQNLIYFLSGEEINYKP